MEIIQIKQSFENQLNEQEIKFEKQLNDEQQEHQEHIQNLTEILSTKAHTIEELNAQIDVLKQVNYISDNHSYLYYFQEASTFTDDKRAHERKGAALVCNLSLL